jgi:hypothetical protein
MLEIEGVIVAEREEEEHERGLDRYVRMPFWVGVMRKCLARKTISDISTLHSITNNAPHQDFYPTTSVVYLLFFRYFECSGILKRLSSCNQMLSRLT